MIVLSFLKGDLIEDVPILSFVENEGNAVAVIIGKRIEGGLELRSEGSVYGAYSFLSISGVAIVKIGVILLIINIVFVHLSLKL